MALKVITVLIWQKVILNLLTWEHNLMLNLRFISISLGVKKIKLIYKGDALEDGFVSFCSSPPSFSWQWKTKRHNGISFKLWEIRLPLCKANGFNVLKTRKLKKLNWFWISLNLSYNLKTYRTLWGDCVNLPYYVRSESS